MLPVRRGDALICATPSVEARLGEDDAGLG